MRPSSTTLLLSVTITIASAAHCPKATSIAVFEELLANASVSCITLAPSQFNISAPGLNLTRSLTISAEGPGATLNVAHDWPLQENLGSSALSLLSVHSSEVELTNLHFSGEGQSCDVDRFQIISGKCAAGIFISGHSKLTITNSSFNGLSGVFEMGGGAIRSEGSLEMSGCTFDSNFALSSGGAMGVYGVSRIANSTFSRNGCNYGCRGGAIDATAALEISSCAFNNNRATEYADSHGGGEGGAISSLGNLAVTRTTFESNTGSVGGALFLPVGSVLLDGCNLVNNQATRSAAETPGIPYQGGGAIFISGAGNSTVRDCSFRGNTAEDSFYGRVDGGALHVSNTSATLTAGEHAVPLVSLCRSTFVAALNEHENGVFADSGVVLYVKSDGTLPANATSGDGVVLCAQTQSCGSCGSDTELI